MLLVVVGVVGVVVVVVVPRSTHPNSSLHHHCSSILPLTLDS